MPSAKTEITEIVTGLAISGAADGRRGAARSPGGQRRRRRLGPARRPRRGRTAPAGVRRRVGQRPGLPRRRAGLRGRPPQLVEWKGPTHAPGDEVVPADLRVDHVWLVSCKYLSKVLANAAPSRLFDRGLAGGPAEPRATGTRRSPPTRTRRSSRRCASSSAPGRRCRPTPATSPRRTGPSCARTSMPAGRRMHSLPTGRWRSRSVRASADRWKPALAKRADAEAVLWRLLRIGSAPYFVLGAQRDRNAAPPGDDARGTGGRRSS